MCISGGLVAMFRHVAWIVATLAASTAIGAVIARYRGDLARARTAARAGSLMAATTSGPIEYAEQGSGAAMLSIHGAGGGFDQGLANATELIGDDFRVVAPSRFGYLRTPLPEDTLPAAQADAHAALLAALRIPRAIVVGVSAGARSALELAIRHPELVTVLILIVPGTYAPTSPVAIESSRGSKLAFWLVNAGMDFAWWAAEKMALAVLIRFLGVRPELFRAAPNSERDRVMQLVRSVQPLSLRFAGINVDSTPGLHELPLERIIAPTLVVSARDDLFNTAPAAEFAAAGIPGARLTIYDTGGHLLVGRGPEVRALVQSFLAQLKLPGVT